MVKHPGQPDSLFRPDSATWRRETYTFRFATQEQRPELSDSLVNSPRPVNRPVRLMYEVDEVSKSTAAGRGRL